MKKEYKSSIIKNHKTTKKDIFYGIPKRLCSLLSYF